MRIAGYQPLSLLDFPGTVCGIVFTQGCAFRCPYCHNPELVPHKLGEKAMTVDEVLAQAREHRTVVDGVCVTGGEPTIQPDLPDFLRLLKAEGLKVKLDTNGVNPTMLYRILYDGLADYVAMDLKHTWEKYGEATWSGGPTTIANCRKSFQMIEDSGVAHEFRTTVVPGIHELADLHEMAGYIQDGGTYALQQVRYGKTLGTLPRPKNAYRVTDIIGDLKTAFPALRIRAR